MRIGSIQVYDSVCASKKYCQSVRPTKITKLDEPKPVPCFQGCNFFKVTGFIAGAFACAVLAPGLAMAGLAGLGAVPGAMLGASIDEKIDDRNSKDVDS